MSVQLSAATSAARCCGALLLQLIPLLTWLLWLLLLLLLLLLLMGIPTTLYIASGGGARARYALRTFVPNVVVHHLLEGHPPPQEHSELPVLRPDHVFAAQSRSRPDRRRLLFRAPEQHIRFVATQDSRDKPSNEGSGGRMTSP